MSNPHTHKDAKEDAEELESMPKTDLNKEMIYIIRLLVVVGIIVAPLVVWDILA